MHACESAWLPGLVGVNDVPGSHKNWFVPRQLSHCQKIGGSCAMNDLPPISPGTNSCRVPARMWQGSERGPDSRQMWAG